MNGLYQISNLGNIRRLRFINNIVNKEKISMVKKYIINSGYEKVMLYKNNKYENKLVHRLVAETFIENKYDHKYINHINGIKTDNKATNLEWCSANENMKHAYIHNLKIASNLGRFGSDSFKAIKINMIDKKTNKIIKTFGSLIEGAYFVGTNKSCHICSCCKGKLKSAYGYKWEYANLSD